MLLLCKKEVKMISLIVIPLVMICSAKVKSSIDDLPEPVAFYPLNKYFTTNEEQNRAELRGSVRNVVLTRGPHNEAQGAYQFSGNSNSYIEFPNSGGILDLQHSFTLMCWVRPGRQDGPLFNYNKADAWGVHIWIVNGKFFNRVTKYPNHAFLPAIMSDQPLQVGKWVHVAATYNHLTGANSLYVNGVLSKTQNIGTGYRISTNDAAVRMGVKDGDSRYFKGAISQMRVYNVALTPEGILSVINQECRQPLGMENGAIRDKQISASSQWDSNHAAIQGRLHFRATSSKAGSWSARTNDVNQWIQIDLRKQQTNITRIATQGRNGHNQWVISYKLQYSDDGQNFHYYREQGQTTDKEFEGNFDQDTVVFHELNPPITARYIRFRPTAWYGHISMRVEVYGCKECQQSLGMENGAIPNQQISASSQWDSNHAAFQGRLHFQATSSKAGSWSARTNDVNQWLQIDLGNQATRVTRVATQGRNGYSQWVTKYNLQYSDDGQNFQYYRERGQTTNKEFAGNSDQETVVYHELNPPIRARYIRFRPAAWYGHISMRVEVYGCKECQQSLGMENGAIPNEQISASSQWDSNHAAFQARLHFQATSSKAGSWSARTNDVNQWLQIDLGNQATRVTHVATQGRNGYSQWVTKYNLQYSVDGQNFQYYRERGQTTSKEFAGNSDQKTVVYHELIPPIRARYIRFRPTAWYGHVSMRVEVYGCKECQRALGMETGAIPNEQISASSQWDANHAAIQGKLYFRATSRKAGSWSARTNDVNQWLQIDLGNQATRVTRVATQGRNGYSQWVTRYNLQYSDDGQNFQYYREYGQTTNKEFAGNSDQDTVVYHELYPPITARYIRFRPTAWYGHISMRVEVYGCKECQRPLGMENGAIPNGQISASSEWGANHATIQSRLHFQGTSTKAGSWSALTNDVNQWLQIDLGNLHTTVTRVATQGRNGYSQWVTKYKLQYSEDGVNYHYYREYGQRVDKEFAANSDRDTVVFHELNPPIRARYIRFRPAAWYGHISMRVEVYGCSCSAFTD